MTTTMLTLLWNLKSSKTESDFNFHIYFNFNNNLTMNERKMLGFLGFVFITTRQIRDMTDVGLSLIVCAHAYVVLVVLLCVN